MKTLILTAFLASAIVAPTLAKDDPESESDAGPSIQSQQPAAQPGPRIETEGQAIREERREELREEQREERAQDRVQERTGDRLDEK